MRIPFFVVAVILLILAAFSFSVTKGRVGAANACGVSDLSEIYDPEAKVAVFEGKEIFIPSLAADKDEKTVLGTSDAERWIEIDLSEQKIRAWEGNSLYLESLVSTGLPWWPTPKGEFRIWIKLRSTKMEGGTGKYYYYLPNVPYVMYFENGSVPGWRGYGLHGTYWHNAFGTQRSHGCVNLPTPIAQQLFSWVSSKGEGGVGTRIVIHD
ncbi:L,D-transpeptidase [Candidatus Woesebacteria bacterium]|nr:L,D-transpeptidase [Candidatus Woesebacteria bacterium]